MRKWHIWVVSALLAAFCLAPAARAYDWLPEDVGERTCSLTVNSRPGVTFRAYQVCTVDRRVAFTATGGFTDAAGTIEELCQAGRWTALLDYVQRYMLDRQIAPVQTAETNRAGKCVFTGLPTGLYLVTGYQQLPNGESYRSSPFLICLPNWVRAGAPGNPGAADGWSYAVEATPKLSPDDQPDKVKVLKIWENVPLQSRPASIKVQLWKKDPANPYGAGELYDERELGAWNNWSVLWTELERGWDWEVRESDGSQGFEVRYAWDGVYNVTIINSRPTPPPDDPKNDPDDPPDNPDPPDRPDPPDNPDPPDDPNHPNNPNNPNNPDSPDSPNYDPDPPPPDGPPNVPTEEDLDDPDTPLGKPELPLDEEEEPYEEEEEDLDDPDTPLARLPQTGVLWWPVPFLAVGGMFFFLLGWGLNRRERGDEE